MTCIKREGVESEIPEYIFEKLNEREKQDMVFTIISASVAGTHLKECDVKRKIPNYFFEKLNEDEINDIISILKNAYQEGIKVRKQYGGLKHEKG